MYYVGRRLIRVSIPCDPCSPIFVVLLVWVFISRFDGMRRGKSKRGESCKKKEVPCSQLHLIVDVNDSVEQGPEEDITEEAARDALGKDIERFTEVKPGLALGLEGKVAAARRVVAVQSPS